MKLRIIAMAAAITGIGAASAEAKSAGAGEACTVTVSFESVCCGVDRGAYADLKAYLAGNPLAKETTDRAWGMEGEQTLCVQARSTADAEALYGQIRSRLPATARAGYILVSVGGKERLRIPVTPRSKVGPKGPKG